MNPVVIHLFICFYQILSNIYYKFFDRLNLYSFYKKYPIYHRWIIVILLDIYEQSDDDCNQSFGIILNDFCKLSEENLFEKN
jgi:hypothetical protein